MIAILDKLVILYIYVNIVANKFMIFSVLPGKIIFSIISIVFALHLFLNKVVIPKRVIIYILASFTLIFVLSTISIFFGNELENVLEFVKPLFVTLLIPVFMLLLKSFTIEKYLNHILFAVSLLAFYVLMLFLFFSQFPTWNDLAHFINGFKELGTTILYRESGLQVQLVSSGWFPLGLILAFNKMKEQRLIPNAIAFFLILFALYISKTGALWSSSLCAFFLFVFLTSRKKSPQKIILIFVLIVLIFVVIANTLPDDIISSKIYSINQKQEQTNDAMSIFYDNMVFGKGLGYVFNSCRIPSISGDESIFLEVTYPMILVTTGLIGGLSYAFIFLYYPVVFIALKQKNMPQRILFVGYIGVLVAAIGNPYLWGGGLGLLLISLLAASVEYTDKKTNQGNASLHPILR